MRTPRPMSRPITKPSRGSLPLKLPGGMNSPEGRSNARVAAPPFASEVESMLERDFAHAVMIDPKSFSEQPFWWRLGVDLSRLASPVL